MPDSSFLLVSSSAVPEVFRRVVEAKGLLSTGKAVSSAQAARMAGISRSAFYKYKDAVFSYADHLAPRIISVHAVLQDRPGVLMALVSAFYNAGANILTVNQNIPIGGAALVSVSADVEQLASGVEELLESLRKIPGVETIESVSGNMPGAL